MSHALALAETGRSAWRHEILATSRLAAPIIATQLAQVSIMTIDVLMMGWLGAAALAAGAVGSNLFFMVVVFGFGICMATGPLMAQAIGRRLRVLRDVRRSVHQGFWAAALLTLPATLLLGHAEDLLLLLRQDPAIAAEAHGYTFALMWGLFPVLGFMVLRQFIGALQRPRAALAIQALAVVINALGNWLLMFGHLGLPALGVVGAGIASAIANWLAFAALLVFVLRDRRMRRFRLQYGVRRADRARLVEVFRLGMPIAGTLLLEVSVFAAAVYMLGAIDTEQLAAHQIAIQCAAFTFMVPFGLAQAATVRVGIAAGALDHEGVRRAGWTAFLLGLGFMSATAVALFALRMPVVALFLDLDGEQNRRVAGHAAEFLAVAAVFQVVDGSQTIAMGALRGLKDTAVPMLIAAFGYWVVGFGACWLAAFVFGLAGFGIWMGLALGLAVVAVLATLRFAARERLGLLA